FSIFHFQFRTSYLLRLIFSEQARRAEEKDGDEDHEGDGVAVIREAAPADEGFDDADRQTTDDGTGNIADAAEDGGDEGFESGHDAHERIDLRIRETVENSGDGGERRADDERRRDHA